LALDEDEWLASRFGRFSSVDYFTALSVSNARITDLEGSGRCLIEALSRHLPGGGKEKKLRRLLAK
jgi:hypothetical protein